MDKIKIFQLADDCFQSNVGQVPHISSYIGSLEYVESMILASGYIPGDIIPVAGIPGATYQNCLHNFKEMGFMVSNIRCTFCDEKQV